MARPVLRRTKDRRMPVVFMIELPALELCTGPGPVFTLSPSDGTSQRRWVGAQHARAERVVAAAKGHYRFFLLSGSAKLWYTLK